MVTGELTLNLKNSKDEKYVKSLNVVVKTTFTNKDIENKLVTDNRFNDEYSRMSRVTCARLSHFLTETASTIPSPVTTTGTGTGGTGGSDRRRISGHYQAAREESRRNEGCCDYYWRTED